MNHDWLRDPRRSILEKRATLFALIRGFMQERDVLEVDTPTLSATATPDPNLQSLSTQITLPDATRQTMYLHTSPEFAMKRLLANGAGSIYQINHVYRDQELGQQHQPEFSMLEWYRIGFNTADLMDEIQQLLTLLELPHADTMSYQDLFLAYSEINPHTCETEALKTLAGQHGLVNTEIERSDLLDYLFDCFTQQMCQEKPAFFIHDFPVCQASLAKIKEVQIPLADRFELFIKGLEIANGFHELNDSEQQRQRFIDENQRRRQRGLPEVALDEQFLDCLDKLPDCSGVALGLDRLLMCITGADDINDVVNFPVN